VVALVVGNQNGRPSRRARVAGLINAVANADPGAIESATRQRGESKKFLAPVAWAAS
jgi:hypothetical protein